MQKSHTFLVKRYNSNDKIAWDSFVIDAKNGTFLFQRDFMEYHNDRFDDYSLMIFKEDVLIALLPANFHDNKLYSHQGLTFGGVIFPFNITHQQEQEVLECILNYLTEKKITSLTIKTIPEIYYKEASKENLYHSGKVQYKNMVLALDYNKPWTIHKTKLKRYRNCKYDFSIKETKNFEEFWEKVLTPRLQFRHNVKPVHSLDEINLLSKRFPNEIKQFNIYLEDEILAGITIFENETVVKSQYGATTEKGEKTRALDYLFLHLIFKYEKMAKHYFSMGTVTENNELGYNPGLKKQKEELGCNIYFQDVVNFYQR